MEKTYWAVQIDFKNGKTFYKIYINGKLVFKSDNKELFENAKKFYKI